MILQSIAPIVMGVVILAVATLPFYTLVRIIKDWR